MYGVLNRLIVILGAATFILAIAVLVTGGGHHQIVAMISGFVTRHAMSEIEAER
mgnify:CR=1 FL=1